jgi:hypothetical protein
VAGRVGVGAGVDRASCCALAVLGSPAMGAPQEQASNATRAMVAILGMWPPAVTEGRANGLELSCPAEAGNSPLLYVPLAGQASNPEGPARRVSFSELLGVPQHRNRGLRDSDDLCGGRGLWDGKPVFAEASDMHLDCLVHSPGGLLAGAPRSHAAGKVR